MVWSQDRIFLNETVPENMESEVVVVTELPERVVR